MTRAGNPRNDPANYAKMLEPYASNEEASAAYAAFFEELYELRNKYRIPDLFYVAEMMVSFEKGTGSAMLSGHIGNPSRKPMLAAFGYGEAKAEHDADLLMLQTEGASSVDRRTRK